MVDNRKKVGLGEYSCEMGMRHMEEQTIEGNAGDKPREGYDPEHERRLRASLAENNGCARWSQWVKQERDKNPHFRPLLAGVNLKNHNLSGADLQDANLRKAFLEKANLRKAVFTGANLQKAFLMEANLQEADLTWANLRKAVLWEANLQEADLTWANLRKAVLLRANLQKADLTDANLQKADLMGADLQKADLRQADLRESDLTGVRGYCRWGKYKGIRLSGAFGNPLFVRFALDQDYIESFRSRDSIGKVKYYIWLILADCGRSFWPLILWAMAFIFGFAAAYYHLLPAGAFDMRPGLKWSFLTAVYYSVVTFTTLGFGDVSPLDDAAKVLVMLEVTMGYVTLGALLSILANKLARRS